MPCGGATVPEASRGPDVIFWQQGVGKRYMLES